MKFISKPSIGSLLIFILGGGIAVFGFSYWAFGKRPPSGGDGRLSQLQAERANLISYNPSKLMQMRTEQSMLNSRLWHKDDFDQWSGNISDGVLVLSPLTDKDSPVVDANAATYLIRLQQLEIDNLGKFLVVLDKISSHAGTRIVTVDLQTTTGDPAPTRFDHAFVIFSVVFPHKQTAADTASLEQ